MRPVTTITWTPAARAAAIAAAVRGRSSASSAIERPVEIGRERPDVAREGGRELDRRYGVPPVALTTYDATSAICCGVSCPLNDGIGDFPSVTRAVARR